MKKNLPIITISIAAIALSLWWWHYTHFTAEDTFITFRFAQHVYEGQGFVFNLGERMYGTTTPLLTLLLAGWLFISKDLVLGSKLIGLFASVGGLWFLYFSFLDRRTAIIATSLIAVSMKLIAEDLQGMETPLLFLFAMGAFYGYAKGKPYLSGIMCGLLLWTRIDAVVFVATLFIAHMFWGTLGRLTISTIKFTIGTLVYLPWLIFAKLYFGSIIPFTITAKIVAYAIGNPPLPVHFLRIIDYISWPVFLLTILSILYLPKRNMFLALFFTVNFIILSKSGSTFMERYFYTTTIASLIMVAVMAGRMRNAFWEVVIILFVMMGSFNQLKPVDSYRDMQSNRHALLKDMGIWLKVNTPEDSTILLEPLGYVGYYADRNMLDQVGLVTPKVVTLYKMGVRGNHLYAHLWPDYIVSSCGEYEPLTDDFITSYKMIQKFEKNYPRACYEVWVNKGFAKKGW